MTDNLKTRESLANRIERLREIWEKYPVSFGGTPEQLIINEQAALLKLAGEGLEKVKFHANATNKLMERRDAIKEIATLILSVFKEAGVV